MTRRLDGSLLYLRPFGLEDLDQLTHLRRRNREFLQPFEPVRSETFFTANGQRADILEEIRARALGVGYVFGMFDKLGGELVGRIALVNVIRGSWHNATLGYFVDREWNSRGLCTDAVRLCVEFAFTDLKLHRVQAGTLVDNTASQRVLAKAGFRFEGIARRYLKIDGAWRDHNIYAITSEEHDRAARRSRVNATA